MSLVLPPTVQADLEREQFIERQGYLASTFKRLLQDLDPLLELVWVKSRAPEMPGLVPGRWHIRRRNPDCPDSYMVIQTEDGEYLEPHAGIIDQLRERDLWRHGDGAQWRRQQRWAEEGAAERKKALQTEQRKDHIAEDYRAAKRVAGESLHRKRWGLG